MRLLVTGCSGFLGKNVSEAGARNGHDILGIGRSGCPSGWPGEYLQRNLTSDFAAVIHDYRPDAILHFAGPASVDASFLEPFSDQQASVLTWSNTLESVRRSGLSPLVLFPSSASVYGNPHVLPVSEHAAVVPISPYGFHKAACELLALEYSECFGLDIIVCRFFSLFGVSQQRLLIWELYKQLIDRNSTIWLEGTGTESRDYLHVDDATSALFGLIENRLRLRNEKSRDTGQMLIVNIGSGQETNVLELAKQLRNLVAPEKHIRCRGSKRRGTPEHWCANISRLRSLIPRWKSKALSVALPECVDVWQGSYYVV